MEVFSLPGFYEPVCALTHLVGAAVFASLAFPLLRRARGDRRRVAILALYSFACVFLLAVSGVFHMLPEDGAGRAVMGRLDKAAIFVLIAGTHAPVQGLYFRGAARWGVLICMWLLAAIGITLFTVFYDSLSLALGTLVYL